MFSQKKNNNPTTPNFHLLQGRLPGFLRDVELTAAGQRLRLRGGLSALQVASLQVLRVAAPPRDAGRRQRRVPALLSSWGSGPGGRGESETDIGLSELLFLHQQGVAAGRGAEPAAGRRAGGGAGAEGAGEPVAVGERVQQGEVEALPVPAAAAAHVPVAGDGRRRVILRGNGGDLNAGALNHTGLRHLEEYKNKCLVFLYRKSKTKHYRNLIYNRVQDTWYSYISGKKHTKNKQRKRQKISCANE